MKANLKPVYVILEKEIVDALDGMAASARVSRTEMLRQLITNAAQRQTLTASDRRGLAVIAVREESRERANAN